jgi:hypothetical protein
VKKCHFFTQRTASINAGATRCLAPPTAPSHAARVPGHPPCSSLLPCLVTKPALGEQQNSRTPPSPRTSLGRDKQKQWRNPSDFRPSALCQRAQSVNLPPYTVAAHKGACTFWPWSYIRAYHSPESSFLPLRVHIRTDQQRAAAHDDETAMSAQTQLRHCNTSFVNATHYRQHFNATHYRQHFNATHRHSFVTATHTTGLRQCRCVPPPRTPAPTYPRHN